MLNNKTGTFMTTTTKTMMMMMMIMIINMSVINTTMAAGRGKCLLDMSDDHGDS